MLISQELVPTHENAGKASHWISLLRKRSNSTRLSKWLPDCGVAQPAERLTSHTCAAGGWEIYWVESWLCWSPWQNSHRLQAGLGFHPLHFCMWGQQPNTGSCSTLPGLFRATCQRSMTSPELQHFPPHNQPLSPGEVNRLKDSKMHCSKSSGKKEIW